MTTQQSGMQQTQQSKPPQSQSRHLVLPGAVPPGLMIELVAEPGRTESRGVEMDSVHMAFGGSQGCQGLGNGPSEGRSERLRLSSTTDYTRTFVFFYILAERCGLRRLCSCSMSFGGWAKGQKTRCDAPHLMYSRYPAVQGYTAGSNG